MTHELTHAVVAAGTINDDDLGSHDIRDGRMEVEDEETARALVARYRAVEWAAGPPEPEDEDDSEDEDTGRKTDEGDEPLVETDPEQLTEAQRLIDSADYQILRRVAGEFDGVAGNQSKAELRVALHTDVDGDAVVEAFETVGTAEE